MENKSFSDLIKEAYDALNPDSNTAYTLTGETLNYIDVIFRMNISLLIYHKFGIDTEEERFKQFDKDLDELLSKTLNYEDDTEKND